MYDKLTRKVNNIDTSRFLLKNKYDTDKLKLEIKIPDVSYLVKKSDYNTKDSEIVGKIPSITTAENKIPSVSTLVKKTNYKTKISDLEKKRTDHKDDKYITTPEFHKLTAENFAARLAKANLVTKTDFDNKLRSLNGKITSNKTNI